MSEGGEIEDVFVLFTSHTSAGRGVASSAINKLVCKCFLNPDKNSFAFYLRFLCVALVFYIAC